MSEPFDPNTMSDRKRGSYDWATYVPSRRPKFKIHEHRGHAINAVKRCYGYQSNYDETGGGPRYASWRELDEDSGVKLYRRQDGRWVEVALLPTYTREQPNIIDMAAESSRILAHIEAKRKEQKQ